MRQCNTCGGTIKYINNQAGRCEYCGRLFSIQENELVDANPEELYREATALANQSDENNALLGVSMLEALGGYKDSAEKAIASSERIARTRAEEQDRKLEEQRRAEQRKIQEQQWAAQQKKKRNISIMVGMVISVICIVVLSVIIVSKNRKKAEYSEALSLYEKGSYEEALEKFENLKGYSDSSEYVDTISSIITERQQTYDRALNYFQKGQYANAIEEFAKCLPYADSQDYTDKASEKIYQKAEEAQKSEDYKKAKEFLEDIPEGSSAFNNALVLLSEVNETLKEIENAQNYAQAIEYFEKQEYEAAQKLFIPLGAYEDSVNYLTQIGEVFYKQAEALYNQQEYAQCGDQIALIETEEQWSNYANALELKQKAAEAYKNIISEEAKKICRKDGSPAMKTFLDNSVCSVLSKSEVEELKDSCLIETISLSKIKPYVTGKYELSMETSVSDNFGNKYSLALRAGESDYYGEQSNTYFIDQKYSTFTATVALERNKPAYESGVIRIYGDKNLLWSNESIKRSTKPYDIEIDVSGVTDLKVEMYGSGWDLVVLLANPTLSE